MTSITILGHCPGRILSKAIQLIRTVESGRARYRKLSGLRHYSTIRINKNYRLLMDPYGSAFIGSHDDYERKIKQLKKVGGV
ncbi:hypothetical protein [Vibrio vulnificus]|jgi:hypothetical protein|uniref:ParE family toxin-like protein n=1 Tax=Vibrio vulnificus TaxID=672 RepID=UPI003B50237D